MEQQNLTNEQALSPETVFPSSWLEAWEEQGEPNELDATKLGEEGQPALLPPWMEGEEANEAIVALHFAFLQEKSGRPDLFLLASNLSLIPLAALMMWSLSIADGWHLLLWSAMFAGVMKLNRLAGALERTKAALKVGRFEPKQIGLLVEALQWPDNRIQDSARSILIQMLPHLKEEDAKHLTDQHRAILYGRLRISHPPQDTPLLYALLTMLEKTGEAQSLSYVEALAESFAWTRRQRKVRAAARRCLPLLQERVEQELALQSQRALEEEEKPTGEALQAAESVETQFATADVEKQLKSLEEERRRHRQPGMRLGFLLASWCIILPYTAFQAILSLVSRHWSLGLMWGLLTAFTSQMHRYTLSIKQTEAAKRLAQNDDIHAVGSLAEALEWPDNEIKHIAAGALARLLPRLQVSDARLLNSSQRTNLYRMLKVSNARRYAELQVAILKAMEQVGDAAALPYVQNLAKSQAWTQRQRRVVEAANECLPYLEIRARQENHANTLLRPAGIDQSSADVLLRPALTPPNEPPEELLRATSLEKER